VRDIDRCRSLRIGRTRLDRCCAVIDHAGRSLGHRGAKRKALAESGINRPLAVEFVIGTPGG
jgi:hypothetical protein